MKNDLITQFEIISEQIAKYFCDKYFKSSDYYWIGKKIGSMLNINDYYFSLEDMLDYMRHEYTPKQMFEHYDYALEERSVDKYPICIRDYKKLK